MLRFIQLVSPFKWHLLASVLVAFASAADMTLKPYCIKWIIDITVSLPEGSNLLQAAFYPVVGYFSLSVLMLLAYRTVSYVGDIRMTPALRQHLCLWGVDQLMKRPYPFFQQHFAGALSQQIQDVVSAAPDFVEMAFGRFLVVGLAIVIGTVALMQASPVFGLIMISWTLVFLAVCIWVTPMLARLASNWAQVGTKVNGAVVDWITNSASTIIFGRQSYERNTIKQRTDEAIVAEQKQQWANFWVATILGVWTVFIVGLTLFLLLDHRQKGYVSAGDFALVLTINTVLIHQVWQVNGECARFARLWGRIRQGMNSLYSDGTPPALQDSSINLSPVNSEVDIQHVSFQYADATVSTLNDVSLTIPSHQKVGIVGYSGAGKSTLIHVLLRLFEPQKGCINMCGFDASSLPADHWRSFIGLIPQDPSLFHRSLMENIRYGKLDATDDEVVEAAKKARAHDFIINLPHGYNSLVGERGVKLSGGQRQRIAIARAILKNAPILVLDEATSQLDSVTESDIQDSLWDVMQGKTTLVVAHRLSTLLRMDRIIVMSAGRVVEDGTHTELLAKNGMYATLWNAQVGDFLGDKQ